jgi:hypothetical protein
MDVAIRFSVHDAERGAKQGRILPRTGVLRFLALFTNLGQSLAHALGVLGG